MQTTFKKPEKRWRSVSLIAGIVIAVFVSVISATAAGNWYDSVADGDLLSADSWNEMINQIRSWKRVEGTDDVILGAAGEVGLGVADPTRKLDIGTPAGTNAEIGLKSADDAGSHWGIYHDGSSNELRMWKNNENRLSIGADGTVVVSGKAISQSTTASDAGDTLVTKDYVEASAASAGKRVLKYMSSKYFRDESSVFPVSCADAVDPSIESICNCPTGWTNPGLDRWASRAVCNFNDPKEGYIYTCCECICLEN